METVFKSIPNDKFFLETDTIEETLEEVYQKAALCKNISVEELLSKILNNWKSIF
jgi:TatD DNase family protein